MTWQIDSLLASISRELGATQSCLLCNDNEGGGVSSRVGRTISLQDQRSTSNGSKCYMFGILFPLLFLLADRDRRDYFIRFHCFQCLLFCSLVADAPARDSSSKQSSGKL